MSESKNKGGPVVDLHHMQVSQSPCGLTDAKNSSVCIVWYLSLTAHRPGFSSAQFT